MSPSESDLRAALRDGEGEDAVDVDRVLAHARTTRTQRRTRVLAAAAAVVVVAGAAVGGAVVWGGSGGGQRQAGEPSSATSPVGPASRSAAVLPPASDDGPAALCPGTFPVRTAPSNRSSATTGAMFDQSVRTVVVCGYSSTGAQASAPSGSTRLTGSDATALTTTIEQASTSKLAVMCPQIRSAQRRQLAIVAYTADGHALPTVTTDVSLPNCNQPITNGTAVRWAWKPPADLSGRIAALTGPTRRQPVGGVSGGVRNGTPVR